MSDNLLDQTITPLKFQGYRPHPKKCWLKNPKVIVDKPTQFIPSKGQCMDEKMNSILRFSIYFGIVVSFVTKDWRWFFFPILVAMFQVAIVDNTEQYDQLLEENTEKINKSEIVDDGKKYRNKINPNNILNNENRFSDPMSVHDLREVDKDRIAREYAKDLESVHYFTEVKDTPDNYKNFINFLKY